MIKHITSKLKKPFREQDFMVSVSGGVDSMVLLDVLRRYGNVEVIHINHRTGNFSNVSQELVERFCELHNIKCNVFVFDGVQPTSNKESIWRDFRYSVYNKFKDRTICQAHTLNDQVEQYLMSVVKGSTRTIAERKGNVFRPFIDVEKEHLYAYAKLYNVPFVEDPTNFEVDGMYDNQRAFVRNVLLPNALIVNPGLFKTVRKFIKSTEFNKDDV